MFLLGEDIRFPNPELADPSGVVAIGGDLRVERLLSAYHHGIFPWPHRGLPLLWFSPNPRMVLEPDALVIPRSLRKVIRQRRFELRVDTAFEEVIRGCGETPRGDGGGTWITRGLVAAYTRLHALGWAHSFEAWQDGALVGGLYGVQVAGVFCGESMFFRVPDASKVAFVASVVLLRSWGCTLVDCQVHTDHLARFGAREIPRREYLARLAATHGTPFREPGRWTLDPGFDLVAAIDAHPPPG